jgi:hypothetical protein
MIGTSSVGSVGRAPRLRRIAGFVLIAAGSLWTLCMYLLLSGMWALAGPASVAYLLLDMTFFGLTLLGPVVIVFGIKLVNKAPQQAPLRMRARRARRPKAMLLVIVPLALTIGAAFLLGVVLRHDHYPFADVPNGGLIAYSGTGGIRLVRAEGGRSWLVPGTEDMSGPEWAPDGERFAAVDF